MTEEGGGGYKRGKAGQIHWQRFELSRKFLGFGRGEAIGEGIECAGVGCFGDFGEGGRRCCRRWLVRSRLAGL